ncbi:Uncharacterised protein [Mycobacteroides abscessus subsp. abscessus]|nr:Uncharacterised protein [Mycobacteroides abscessus subsp. abscessus]
MGSASSALVTAPRSRCSASATRAGFSSSMAISAMACETSRRCAAVNASSERTAR